MRSPASPSAARGWRPSVMSESNCGSPARSPRRPPRGGTPARRRAPAAGRPAAGRRAASGGSSSRRAIRGLPPCTCRHARTPSHGAVERHVPAGDAARADLAERQSRPAGRRSRRPAPPRTPRAAHHGSSRACPRSTATRISVSRRVVGGDVDRRAGAVGQLTARAAGRARRGARSGWAEGEGHATSIVRASARRCEQPVGIVRADRWSTCIDGAP